MESRLRSPSQGCSKVSWGHGRAKVLPGVSGCKLIQQVSAGFSSRTGALASPAGLLTSLERAGREGGRESPPRCKSVLKPNRGCETPLLLYSVRSKSLGPAPTQGGAMEQDVNTQR